MVYVLSVLRFAMCIDLVGNRLLPKFETLYVNITLKEQLSIAKNTRSTKCYNAIRRSYTMRISFVSDQAKTKKKSISLTPQRCLLRKYHVCTVPHQKDVREEIWKIGNLSGFWERDIVLSSLC
jgi:hypothetical protein